MDWRSCGVMSVVISSGNGGLLVAIFDLTECREACCGADQKDPKMLRYAVSAKKRELGYG
jgi:hypothetical protein